MTALEDNGYCPQPSRIPARLSLGTIVMRKRKKRLSQISGSILTATLPLLTLIAFSRPLAAQVAAEIPLHHQIDRMIAAGTPEFKKVAADRSSDSEFLRRVSLDLIGMPPTIADTRTFLADESPTKRTALIDRLLVRPEYARHMQHIFDVILMKRLPQKNVKAHEWQSWLRTAFAENRPWDQMTREILSADGSDLKNRGPARFYLDRDGEVNQITQDIGRIFLGADLACAQCHDHPDVDDFKQAHYYGLSAFLVRSFVFTDKKKNAIFAEKAEGEVSFESVFEVRDKISSGPKSTSPRMFEAVATNEPEFKKDEAYQVKPDKNVRPVPKFSRRAQMPVVITSPQNTRFPRTAANRLWAQMMGRGLVHPVELDHSDNPASHPELLDLLSTQFAEHGFDIKWFLRELVLTDCYQRSSRVDSESEQTPPAAEEAFAQKLMKPLAPAQFARALLEASGEADVARNALGKNLTEESLNKKLVSYENRFVKLFGGVPGKPPVDFESTVAQVLFLSNDSTIQSLIKRKNGNLADRMAKAPADNAAAIADELYLNVLVRRPTSEEIDEVAAHLAAVPDEKRVVAIEELVWALVASSEFRFNH